MPIKVFDSNIGQMREASSRVYSSYWRNTAAWVFSQGAWRRTYDPTDENLLSNSRMLNGTDVYSYVNGTNVGAAPPGWTYYANTSDGLNAAYAYYSSNLDEYSRKYTFYADGSRMFFQGRVFVRAGSTYNANMYVEDAAVSYGRHIARISVDNVPETQWGDYIQIVTDFPKMGDLTNRINCKFTVKKDCVIALNVGVGIDYNDSGYVTINKPMVSKTLAMIDYQPTAKDITYNAVYLMNSWFDYNQTIQATNGTHRLEGSMTIESQNANQYLMFISRNYNNTTDGVGIDTRANKLVVIQGGRVVAESQMIRELVKDQVVGLGIWFDISGGYISNVRLHMNGQLVALIEQRTLTMGTMNTLFGSPLFPTSGVIIEQFALYLNNKTYLFNLEEGSGPVVTSTHTVSVAQVAGEEGTDFVWWAILPMIAKQPDPVYEVHIGDTVDVTISAANWSTVEWRTIPGGAIQGADTETLTVPITADFDFERVYYAVYRTRFGAISTRSFRFFDLDGTNTAITYAVGENGSPVLTEGGKFLMVSEGSPMSDYPTPYPR